MTIQTNINAKDFQYELPEDRIAIFPLEKRDESKLLIYKNNNIVHAQFKNIIDELDHRYTLFFNNTRVIPARLRFRKEEGGVIEIFLLNPIAPASVSSAMLSEGTCTWKCLIGGLKKWRNGLVLSSQTTVNQLDVKIDVELKSREEQLVTFSWQPENLPFAELISNFGNTPLPPYLNRAAALSDTQNYQTVYAQHEGAVAAPTAGLHFTKDVLDVLKNKGVQEDFVTLHVGGGTFQPIRTENVIEHTMHSEQIIVSQQNIKNLIAAEKVCAVGTTSMRTLESLYWIALLLFENDEKVKKGLIEGNFCLEKLTPYRYDFEKLPSKNEIMSNLLSFMQKNDIENVSAATEIMIIPGYSFRCCDALVTNFHQPQTTLMLLVAAFVGEDWRKIYQSALENDYRFLSYGDSSLLFKNSFFN